MTSTASTDWPRAYLFQIHAEAVAHGLIFLEPISKADARSLRQRLYRIRRRSDKSTAIFVPPEYHLVTVGQWEDTPEGGRLPIIYSKTPDGKELPRIRPADLSEASLPMTPAEPLTPLAPLVPDDFMANLDAADLTLKPGEVDSYVQDLMRQAQQRGKKAASDDES